MAVVVASFGVIIPIIFLAQDRHVAFAVMAFAAVAWSTTYGPWFATVQTLVPERMRAMAIAIVFLFANLIGMGIGPLATGFLSDAFRPWAGEDSLRYALLALCPGYVWASWHLWRASRSLPRDLSLHVEAEGSGASGHESRNAEPIAR
jgi:MFS family permease